jgi:transposase-like protein
MANNKYGLSSLRKQFGTDEKCLEYIFKTLHTEECTCGGTFKRKEGRRQWQCSKCRYQLAPTAGTIFHKSDTALTTWFHAIMVFSNAKSGISAMELQRQLEVTYKTAWRMLTLIRKSLKQSDDVLHGDVEMDAGYFGGKGNAGRDNKDLGRVMKEKSVIIAAKERGGQMRASVVPDATAKTHGDFLGQNVSTKGTRLMTDSTRVLNNVALGYDRYMVDHHIGEYVRGDIHVNSIETFWAHVKRSMRGTHKVVSKKYLQSYLDGFVFHANNQRTDRARFEALLGMILHA